MADNPDIKWALDILTPEPDYKPSLFFEYGFIVGAPVATFVSVCMINTLSKRPALSGLQNHIMYSILTCGFANWLQTTYNNFYARRDQLLRDYVIKHPDDFIQPERKKWADVFEPWNPIR